VLLLRGARQTGKTYSVRQLGKSFEHFIEVNFEERPELCAFFNGPLTPQPICEKLAATFNTPIYSGRTLVFFDEIQSCPGCLRALRFFHEQMPELHVAAAGSMLEFALSEIPSFGVGRIESLFLFPMSFPEFLKAADSGRLWEAAADATFDKPVDPVLHNMLLDRLRTYLCIGGMPKVVAMYCENHDLLASQDIIANLIATLRDDLAKYKNHESAALLNETLLSAAQQAGGKFMYSRVSKEQKHYHIKQAFLLLEKAGLTYRISHTSAQGVPLGAQEDSGHFKALPFDTGVYQRLLELDLSAHFISNSVDMVNKGSLAEVFAGLELLSSSRPNVRPHLFYWHRQSPASNAEVDYVIQRHEQIIPVEVKSGTRGAMQSMHLFLTSHNLPFGIRLSQENFSRYGSILTMPVYAASQLRNESFRLP
jgi:predicted AAA+ superfamily ATPase